MRLLVLVLFSLPAFAQTFLEARIGLQDSYSKRVEHATAGILAGDFKGMNYGLRAGKKFGNQALYFEFNPDQEVEIESANELAHVNSYFVGYRYFLKPSFYIGGQVGHSTFELQKGPNGVMFADSPETSGVTYGLNFGYTHSFGKIYLSGEVAYNIGSYKESGPSVTPVRTIEIEQQTQLNLNIGFNF